MPKEITKQMLDHDKSVVLQTLESFSSTPGVTKSYPTAAATRAISQSLVLTKVKPALKQLVLDRGDEIKELYGVNPFLSEAYGTRGKYWFALASTIMYLVDADGTPFDPLKTASFLIMDSYTPDVFRTKGTIGKPRNQARPNYEFQKFFTKVLMEISEQGHVDYDTIKSTVSRESINPVDFTVDFWGKLLHKTRSSWIRSLCAMKASLHAPELSEMYALLKKFHMGSEVGIRREHPDRWYLLTGPEGAGLAFTDNSRRVRLQYEKVGSTPVNLNQQESEATRYINSTIRFLPWVSEEQIKEMFPQESSIIQGAWSKNPETAPIEIARCYAPKEMGIQLHWASKQPLGMEQHNAREILTGVWKYLRPEVRSLKGQIDLSNVENASNVVISAVADLSDGRVFNSRTSMELKTVGALSAYGLVEMTPNGYVVKKGMEHAMDSLALYIGVLKKI
jgi:hypothetical protein